MLKKNLCLVLSQVIIKVLLIIFVFNISSVYGMNQFIINNINFTGLQRIDVYSALSIIPFCKGDIFNYCDLSKIIKSLFKSGYFDDIQVYVENNSIFIQVREKPIITNISFDGNKIIKEEMLRNILKSRNIYEGNFLNKGILFKIKKDLNNFYYNFGKFQIYIKTEVVHLTNNCVALKLIFDEGKTARIKHINFLGNYLFSNHQLLKNLTLYNKYYQYIFCKNYAYQNDKFILDQDNLYKFYLNKGYARFNIDSARINLMPNKTDIYISFYVYEGDQYVFSDYKIEGDINNDPNLFQQIIKINKGELFSISKIRKIQANIEQLLSVQGYIHPNILINSNIDDANKTVELHISVDRGFKFYVNRILFEGNYVTKDSVLRREIKQLEGACFDNNLINQGKKNLEKLGYFSNVEVKVEYVNNTHDQINIIYNVKEKDTGHINASVGIGTESGLNFEFGIQQENFLGSGNFIGFHGKKNNHQTHIELSTIHPQLNNININLSWKLFYDNFDSNNIELINYKSRNYGTGIDISNQINKNNIINAGLNYIYNYITNIDPQILIYRYLKKRNIISSHNTCMHLIDENLNFKIKDFLLISAWNYNNLCYENFPNTGYVTYLSSKITLPFSNNKYCKICLNHNHYIKMNINKDWIFNYNLKFGYSTGIFGQETPFYDNFYAGGVHSIRGFRTNTVGPKAAYYKCNLNNQKHDTCTVVNSNDAVGGNAIFTMRNELIFPLPIFNKQYLNKVRTSLFVDTGTVWDTLWQNTLNTKSAGILNYKDPKNIRISSGIAIQWISPIGPMVFSYAKIIKKYIGDQVEQFQFNVGKTW